ncbi:TonB-dependent receptor [Lacimicrobium alkaliphilum]|uniref:Secretin/TonB short N-terminal domain-containing protein n=1 Tax=Lacimicrobium alkaliphilum TaxID=1526571 RepID=A0ABQ1QX09_9ALTE|nr:TonB-dependent receptor [Lacimicrobium alkaliphilum]GGD49255.1 hypothetical protein GCM10011357_01540 [Lacimicrobium alkaliphilum]
MYREANLRAWLITILSLPPVSVCSASSLIDALEQISEHYGVAIAYPKSDANQHQVENLTLDNKTISEILHQVTKNTNLTFDLTEQGVLLKIKQRAQTTQGVPSQKQIEEVKLVAQALETQSPRLANVRDGYAYSVAMKRKSVGFSDSLVASTIAAYPQQNLAEALLHMPGLSVERNKGLGTRINVRGLPYSFAHMSINGIASASAGSGRELELDMFAPEIVQNVTLKKSSTAADHEGGISGNLYVQTARPFQQPKKSLIFSAETAHNSISEKTDPKFSVLASTREQNWGLLASLTVSRRVNRTDSNSEVGFRPLSRWLEKSGTPQKQLQSDQAAAVLLRDTDITIHDRQDKNETARIVFVNKIGDRAYVNSQDRLAITTALQAQLTQHTLLNFDAIYSAYNTSEDVYDAAAYSASSDSTLEKIHQYDATTLAEHNIVVLSDVSYARTQHEMLSRENRGSKDYQQYSLSMTQQADSWQFDGLLGYSKADKFSDNSNLKHTAYFPSRSRFTDTGGEVLHSTNPLSIDMYNSPQSYQFESYDITVDDVDDKKYTLQLDAKKAFDAAALSSIQFGTRYTKTLKERQNGSRRVTAPHQGDTSSLNNPSMTDSELNTISQLVPGGSYSLADGRNLNWQQVGNDYARKTFRYPGLLTPYEQAQYYLVDEVARVLYAMADFDFYHNQNRYALNLGMRYIDTLVQSSGYHQFQNNDDNDSATNQPVSQTGNYQQWLPSMNASIELNQDLLLRGAMSKTLIRPALDEIAYRRSVSLADFKFHDGNPNLKPTIAQQWELGVEWYLQPEALLSVSYFEKQIDNVIRESLTGVAQNVIKYNDNGTIDGVYDFDIYQYVNADGKYTIKGIEFIAHLPFGLFHKSLQGLGLNSNYTILSNGLTADSDLNIPSSPVGLADESINLALFYERDDVDVHFSYTYKGAYVERIERDMYPVYRDGYGQFDAAIGVRLNQNFKLSIKGLNITDEITRAYTIHPDFPNQYERSGRRLALAINGTF